jgi:hypothetical protein
MIHGFLGALRETTRIGVTEKQKKQHGWTPSIDQANYDLSMLQDFMLFWSSWVAFLGDIN